MFIRGLQQSSSILVVVLFSVVLLVGCGPFAGGNDGKTTITVRTWDAGDNGLLVYRQGIAAFEKAHPNIKIELESDTSSYYNAKLLTSLANGHGPDVFLVFDANFARFVHSGTLLDITHLAQQKKYGIDPVRFYSSAWDIGTFNGRNYFIPKDLQVQSVLYNKKLFREAGLPYPQAGWTLQEFSEAAKKLTVTRNGRTEQWGALLPGNYLRAGLEFMFTAYGAQFLSPDGRTASGYFDSPIAVRAISDYLDMYKQQISPSANQVSGFGNIDLFQTGRVAMQWTSVWSISQYLQDPNLEFDAVAMPIGPTGKQATISYVGGWAINARSQHIEEASALLGFFASQEWAQINSYWTTPALKGKVAEDMQKSKPVLKPFFDQAEAIERPPELGTLNWSKDVGQPVSELIDNMTLEPERDLQMEIQNTVARINANLADTYEFE